MAENPEHPGKPTLPPYIAFKTLIDLIERMEAEDPPTRVDPSYLDSYAGGYRPTVISNLQTLGLLKKSGEPSDELLALVSADEATRKKLIAEMIRNYYGDILALGKNSTQAQFLEAFEARGVRGDTRRKAISFFLKACSWSGIETGTYWKTPPASATGSPRRTKNAVKGTQTNPGTGTDEHEAADHGEGVAEVRLNCGAVLTLALQGNLLTMPKDDRNYVFEIVDKMQEYEQTETTPSNNSPATDEADNEDEQTQ